MRLVLVTEEQFNELWNRLTPVNRVQTDFPGANMYMKSMDALVVVRSDTDIVDVSGGEEPISLAAIHSACIHAEIKRRIG